MPFWLLKGKARLKHEIARRVDIDAAVLPYHGEFLDHLKQEFADGRRLILATASNEKFAHAIALNLGIFHDVLASDSAVNLSGRQKLERLQALIGDSRFDYAGNAMVDLELWDKAVDALLVNPERGVRKSVERQGKVARVFDDRIESSLREFLKALRVHQWLKNLLVFVPLVVAHRLGELEPVSQAMLAFLAFCLCASSGYLLNDLMDLPNDRRHPSKRYRPFASGKISLKNGVMLVPGLALAAAVIALLLPVEFIGVLGLYFALTLAYSLWLKQSAIIDVLTLGCLYTIRIIAGAAAISVEPSFWLLAFSMFLFLSLALVKRFTEMRVLQKQARPHAPGRGYRAVDIETLSQFGSASAYMAVLVLALYIDSEEVRDLYTRPEIIWLLCPLLLYMVSRIWLLARRDELQDDPVVFVIRDRRSQWLAVIGAILLWLAI